MAKSPNKKENPMTMISIRLPEDMVSELKKIAPLVGESGYQPLIRSYIEQGLAQDIKRIDKTNTIDYADQIAKSKESRTQPTIAEPRAEYIVEQQPEFTVQAPRENSTSMENDVDKRAWGKELVALLNSLDKTGWEDVGDAVEWVDGERKKRREERAKQL